MDLLAAGCAARRRFPRDRRGMAAVEFALVASVMVFIYLGAFDTLRMVRAGDKVENAARTAADLVAQESTGTAVPASDVATILQAAAVAASPFNDAKLALTVSAVDLAASGPTCCIATVRWSITQGGTLRPCQTTLRQIGPKDPWAINTIPTSIATQGLVTLGAGTAYTSSLIVTDVSYTYGGVSPLVSKLTSRTMWRHAYSIPRLTGQVILGSASGLANNQSGQVC